MPQRDYILPPVLGTRSDQHKQSKGTAYLKKSSGVNYGPASGGKGYVRTEDGSAILNFRRLERAPIGGATSEESEIVNGQVDHSNSAPGSMSLVMLKAPALPGAVIALFANGDGRLTDQVCPGVAAFREWIGRQGEGLSIHHEMFSDLTSVGPSGGVGPPSFTTGTNPTETPQNTLPRDGGPFGDPQPLVPDGGGDGGYSTDSGHGGNPTGGPVGVDAPGELAVPPDDGNLGVEPQEWLFTLKVAENNYKVVAYNIETGITNGVARVVSSGHYAAEVLCTDLAGTVWYATATEDGGILTWTIRWHRKVVGEDLETGTSGSYTTDDIPVDPDPCGLSPLGGIGAPLAATPLLDGAGCLIVARSQCVSVAWTSVLHYVDGTPGEFTMLESEVNWQKVSVDLVTAAVTIEATDPPLGASFDEDTQVIQFGSSFCGFVQNADGSGHRFHYELHFLRPSVAEQWHKPSMLSFASARGNQVVLGRATEEGLELFATIKDIDMIPRNGEGAVFPTSWPFTPGWYRTTADDATPEAVPFTMVGPPNMLPEGLTWLDQVTLAWTEKMIASVLVGTGDQAGSREFPTNAQPPTLQAGDVAGYEKGTGAIRVSALAGSPELIHRPVVAERLYFDSAPGSDTEHVPNISGMKRGPNGRLYGYQTFMLNPRGYGFFPTHVPGDEPERTPQAEGVYSIQFSNGQLSSSDVRIEADVIAAMELGGLHWEDDGVVGDVQTVRFVDFMVQSDNSVVVVRHSSVIGTHAGVWADNIFSGVSFPLRFRFWLDNEECGRIFTHPGGFIISGQRYAAKNTDTGCNVDSADGFGNELRTVETLQNPTGLMQLGQRLYFGTLPATSISGCLQSIEDIGGGRWRLTVRGVSLSAVIAEFDNIYTDKAEPALAFYNRAGSLLGTAGANFLGTANPPQFLRNADPAGEWARRFTPPELT